MLPLAIRKRLSFKRSSLLLATFVAVVALSFVSFNGHGMVLSPRTASAKPLVTCSGTGCNNTDPEKTGCDSSGETLLSAQVEGSAGMGDIGEVDMRWSTTCQTNWTRGDQFIGCGVNNCIISWKAELAWHTSSGSCNNYNFSGTSNSSPFWTNQEYAPSLKVESYVFVEGFDTIGNFYYSGSNQVTNPDFGTLCVG